MVTIIAEDLISISKVEEAGKRLGIEIKVVNPKNIDMNDDFFIIDYIHPYGVSAARQIKETKPDAKVVGFYPHIRFYIKDEVEKIGCRAFTNSEFFSKTRDILSGKI